jgi:hypothetical protein
LSTALRFPGGFVDDLAVDDAKVSIKKSQQITVTALRRAPQPHYAESPTGQ